ncbi:MAG: hypothetical protein Q7R97_03430 [Candidatus Daviesbacteria bacterium]|nr:hypothetical protein [Candidatus Daviesbacteria bacterium]
MIKNSGYPTNKEILLMLGVGTLLIASIVMPGLGIAAGAIMKAKRKHDWKENQKEWKKFNVPLLRRNLKRLHENKLVEVIEENGQEVVKLSQKGHTKYLKYRMEDWSNKGKGWDGKWRVVIYDISKLKKSKQESFRRMLKQMNFWPLQESVYLIPYQCYEAIGYLREYFNIGEEVMVLEVSKLENEDHYKKYFGI